MKKNIGKIITISLLCISLVYSAACGSETVKVDDTETAESEKTSEEVAEDIETKLTYEDEGDYIIVTGLEDAESQAKEIVIPGSIDGKPVEVIKEDAFRGCFLITKVVLPDSIREIGAHAFDDCSELAEINIPAGVTSIGEGAFFCCESLKEINLPEGLQSIGKGAFYYCISLNELTLPDSLTDLGDYAFYGCEGLTVLYIGSGLKEMSKMAFMHCMAIEKLEIPENIEIIRSYAFSDCASASTVSFPAVLSEIENNAFSGCMSLSSVEVNAKKLGDYAFSFCTNLSEITLGDELTSIGTGCFQTTGLTELTIPASVTELKDGAFRTMYSLEKLNFDEDSSFKVVDGVLYGDDMKTLLYYPLTKYDEVYELLPDTTTIAPYAFENSSVQKVITNTGLETIRESAFSGGLSFSEIQLSDTILTIEADAFADTTLTELKLPASVQEVSSEVDEGAMFSSITVDPDNSYYTAVDGVLYTKDMKTLLVYPNGKEDETFAIPEGTEVIGEKAFWGSNSFKTVTVPASVQKIEEFGLSNTKNVIFEGDVAELAEHAVGYNMDHGFFTSIPKFFIIGEIGSSLEKYAMDHNMGFATDTPVLSCENLSLEKDEEASLTLSNTNPEYVTFWSSDSNIATVDLKGNVKAVAKGETSIIAFNGNSYNVCHVEVTTGDEPVISESEYFVPNIENYMSWEEDFDQANAGVFDDKKYNENLFVYTGGEYVPIVSAEAGEKYEHYASGLTYPDLSLYKMISDDLNLELQRAKLHTDTVFYSGTSAFEIAGFTTTGASLQDMVNAIGTVTTHPEVISTTIDHAVAAGFGEYTLEIYAPKSVVKGSYIKKFSKHAYEYEFLLGSDQKYKIIGAGVRACVPERFDGTPWDPYIEKYLQVEIVP